MKVKIPTIILGVAALAVSAGVAHAIALPLDGSSAAQVKSGPLGFSTSTMSFYVGDPSTGAVLGWGNANSNASLRVSAAGLFTVLSSSGQSAQLPLWFATTTGLYAPSGLAVETNPADSGLPIGSSTLSIMGFIPQPDRCLNSGINTNCTASTPNLAFYQNASGTEDGIMFNAFATSTLARTIINWDWSEIDPTAPTFGILFGGSLGNGLGIAVAGPKPDINSPQFDLKNRLRYGLDVPFQSKAGTVVTLGAPPGEASYAFQYVGFSTTQPSSGVLLDLSQPDQFFKIFPGQSYSTATSTYIGSSNTYNVGQVGYLPDASGYDVYGYKQILLGGTTVVRANDISLTNPSWDTWWSGSATTTWLSGLQSLAVQCGGSPASANLVFWPATSSLAQTNGCSRLKQATSTSPNGTRYLQPMEVDSYPQSGYFRNSWATCPKGFFANIVGTAHRTSNGVVPIISCTKLWSPF